MEVFYPMGWDDNGLPTERRVQNHFGVRCDPSIPYDADFTPPAEPSAKEPMAVSRPNFVELCLRLTESDEQAFEELWRTLGLSVDWSMTYTTIGALAQRISQRSFLGLLAARRGLPARGADAVGRRLPDGRRPGRARGPRAPRSDEPGALPLAASGAQAEDALIETTRPELIPACVALLAHPDDARQRELVGKRRADAAVRHARSGAHPPAGRPGEGHRAS